MKNPITAAIIDSMTAPTPAHTITATIIGPDGTPYRATYTADMLDSLRTEARVLDIQDDETGELIYIKPDDAPAAQAEADPTETENAAQEATDAANSAAIDAPGTEAAQQAANAARSARQAAKQARAAQRAGDMEAARQAAQTAREHAQAATQVAELAAMEAEQAAPAPDPENTTTDEKKEEDNTMSTTERYDYIEHMTEDVKDAIRERYTPDEIRAHLDDDRDDFTQELNDDLWTDDSVTGNASGSYYCNAWRAEDAIAHNWDLIADFIDEWDCADILRKGPEAIDVSIRCYLLGQAIDAALDELDDEIPEAEDDNIEDDEDAADNIPA